MSWFVWALMKRADQATRWFVSLHSAQTRGGRTVRRMNELPEL
jgi:hypothetical protein